MGGVTYCFDGYRVQTYPGDGSVVTFYADGLSCPVPLNAGHLHHAKALRWAPFAYNIAHELSHHLLGEAYFGGEGSAVVRASAEGVAQPPPTRARPRRQFHGCCAARA